MTSEYLKRPVRSQFQAMIDAESNRELRYRLLLARAVGVLEGYRDMLPEYKIHVATEIIDLMRKELNLP